MKKQAKGVSKLIGHTLNNVKLGPCAEPSCGRNWRAPKKGAHEGRYPVRCPKHQ